MPWPRTGRRRDGSTGSGFRSSSTRRGDRPSTCGRVTGVPQDVRENVVALDRRRTELGGKLDRIARAKRYLGTLQAEAVLPGGDTGLPYERGVAHAYHPTLHDQRDALLSLYHDLAGLGAGDQILTLFRDADAGRYDQRAAGQVFAALDALENRISGPFDALTEQIRAILAPYPKQPSRIVPQAVPTISRRRYTTLLARLAKADPGRMTATVSLQRVLAQRIYLRAGSTAVALRREEEAAGRTGRPSAAVAQLRYTLEVSVAQFSYLEAHVGDEAATEALLRDQVPDALTSGTRAAIAAQDQRRAVYRDWLARMGASTTPRARTPVAAHRCRTAARRPVLLVRRNHRRSSGPSPPCVPRQAMRRPPRERGWTR